MSSTGRCRSLPKPTELSARLATIIRSWIWTILLVRPGNWRLANVGEELALHALIDQAEAVLEAAGEDPDLGDFREAAIEDLDCLLLFDLRFDGFEDSPVADRLGMTNLRFEDWFKPFRSLHTG